MDSATQRSIEEAVLDILRNANMEEMTEYKVRTFAADRLGIDLSSPDRKRFVRNVVESFLASHKEDDAVASEAADAPEEEHQKVEVAAAEEEDEAEEEEDDHRKRRGPREYDEEGDLIVCRLSNKRRVTVQDFRGKTLVSIREYYEKEGKQLPTSKVGHGMRQTRQMRVAMTFSIKYKKNLM
ncbi:RNA polymerase II transcriptional coactivator KELP [Dendrobium catenatum]|uniref:RNA polymerase II transcriptional coactivator KELP n=1 Tax=Dendrobium catenatum TaxID=906689 RepID=UPI0009F25BFC|nr:RNA polymerase II transcriptional coactivator KELP [Dendrobium catenatum]